MILVLAGVELQGPRTPAAGETVQAATAERSAEAARHVEDFALGAAALLSDTSLSEARRDESFRRLLLQGFDTRGGARFALGHGWRAASEAQREEFVRLFQKDLLRTAKVLFEGYEGELLEVERVLPWGESQVFVESRLTNPEARIDDVDFRMGHAEGGFQIIDVHLEGLSVLSAYRSEFVDRLFRGGVEGVIELLRERNQD
jgi:phospholipid transport system substrate-binding protein